MVCLQAQSQGKKGIKLVAGASELLVTDSDGLMLIPISAGRPLTSDHVVTKGFLDEYTTPDYVVYGEMLIDIGNTITFGADITPIDGKIYIVTHNEGTLLYNVGELYRFNIELGTYEAVIVSDGAKIVSANTLNTGDITFKNATLYIWEESESLWYEGVRPNMTGVHYTKDFMLTFMNGFDTQIPTGIRHHQIKIKLLMLMQFLLFQLVRFLMGTMGDPISILDGTESDLDNIGYYVIVELFQV